MTVAGWGDDVWEAYDNQGFVYKRKKRPRPDLPTTSSASDPAPSDPNRIIRRRTAAILNVKQKYQAEISQWELLSNTLNALNKKAQFLQRVPEETSIEEVGLGLERECVVGLAQRRRIDDLALRAEADEAFIQEMSNLCDIAEAVCNVREQRLKKEYSDLFLLASPRKMMAVLCDGGVRDIRLV